MFALVKINDRESFANKNLSFHVKFTDELFFQHNSYYLFIYFLRSSGGFVSLQWTTC